VTDRHTSSKPSHPQDTPLQRLGATLRQERKQRRLSQRALATSSGIHHTYISEIELGQRNISLLTLCRLAQVLQMPAARFLAPLETRATVPPPVVRASLPSTGGQGPGTLHDDLAVVPHDPDAALLHRVGATLRHYRRHQALTQEALAVRTGLDTSYIGDIERGERNVSVLSLVRLADALGYAVSTVLASLESEWKKRKKSERTSQRRR
jgi:transcriptional regulator with XRE-family HTH domain